MTSPNPHLENPLFLAEVDAIVRGMSSAFDQIFERPDAVGIVERFLSGDLVFLIERDGVSWADARPADPEPDRQP